MTATREITHVPQLTVYNAQISTATVEIKTLTVTGKQVTLAVFRQLLDEPLIAEDGALNGVPWGTVNYHPDKCGDGGQHLHVVWQKGDELRRSRVDAPAWWDQWFYSEGADDLIQAAYCLRGHDREDGWLRYRWEDGGARGYGIRFELDGMRCETVWEPKRADGHECRTQEDYERELGWVRADIAEEKKRRACINDHWKVLGDL